LVGLWDGGTGRLPVVDARDDRARPAVGRVVPWKRADVPVVRSQDPDDLVVVAVLSERNFGGVIPWSLQRRDGRKKIKFARPAFYLCKLGPR
jgi:hypothetical protein